MFAEGRQLLATKDVIYFHFFLSFIYEKCMYNKERTRKTEKNKKLDVVLDSHCSIPSVQR
jgi:hypothetical protein